MIALALSTEQRALVERVFEQELPEAAVWVFGSRATSVTKPFSDLDLALDLGASLPVERLAALREAFEESELPFKVDLLDVHAADAAFVSRIARGWVRLR